MICRVRFCDLVMMKVVMLCVENAYFCIWLCRYRLGIWLGFFREFRTEIPIID